MTKRHFEQTTLTLEILANELVSECLDTNQFDPKRWAFCRAIDARGTDARTKQFKHYDRIIEWMIANWPELDY